MSMHPLLDRIETPADLRGLERKELKPLADELRTFLIDSVSKTGGHLSSNLGTVELSVALHYVFNTPEDRLVWDVGHQTYCHKILTKRRDAMASLRQYQGISGFPRRTESEYDAFGTAHSSTSISAALGMAQASKLKGEARKTIAVIGDGAMTAGMAFEALNNAGVADCDILVILNDNEMSISPPVGGLNKHLSRLLSGRTFNGAREIGKRFLEKLPPPVFEFAKRTEEHVKGMMMPGTLFEEFGFTYYGPINGHDLNVLIPMLENLRKLKGPQFLHVITRKGQGYTLAEANPTLYHGVTKFDQEEGIPSGSDVPIKSCFTQVFSDWLCDMAKADSRLLALTPAMREGSGLVRFEQEYPDRYFDVGIAEQHALTVAAGMACEGMKPVVAIYSTFLQRAYDQLIHDIALQNLPVMLAIDRGGLVGADGATHHGAFDLSFLACVPNLVIMVPADEDECRKMLNTGFLHNGPSAVRYPRGSAKGQPASATLEPLPIGKGEIRRHGKQVALLAFGTSLGAALEAGEALDATVANMRFVKPLDLALIRSLAAEHELLVTLEENAVIGGAGSEVARALEEAGIVRAVMRIGLPDRFIDHGEQSLLREQAGLTSPQIIDNIRQRLAAIATIAE